ncbi:MAG: hypothetical protein KF779_16610 [Hyphomonadaceae bacterium]|nr:hypothetical protein [Hyphomonadaceae bacterium]
MRAARRVFVLSLAAAGASAVLAPKDAFACQCMEEYWSDMVARVDVIFRGRVISDTPLLQTEPRDLRGWDEREAYYMTRTRLEVLEVVKGDPGETADIVRLFIYSVCGRLLPAGTIVQVAAVRDPEHGLSVAPCDMRDDPEGRFTQFLLNNRP